MSRELNIFHNLVTDENSTTELFCNLMQFAVFRRLFLARFLPEPLASRIQYGDIETQFDLNGEGRPDIIIRSEDVCILVEVKITQYQGLTKNQPDNYFSFLQKEQVPNRHLVFLVPKTWDHRRALEESIVRCPPTLDTTD